MQSICVGWFGFCTDAGCLGSQKAGQMVLLPCRKKVIGPSQGGWPGGGGLGVGRGWSCGLAGDLAPDLGLLREDAHRAFQKPG